MPVLFELDITLVNSISSISLFNFWYLTQTQRHPSVPHTHKARKIRINMSVVSIRFSSFSPPPPDKPFSADGETLGERNGEAEGAVKGDEVGDCVGLPFGEDVGGAEGLRVGKDVGDALG